MPAVTRRRVVELSTGAAVACATGAAAAPGPGVSKGQRMDIQRYEQTPAVSGIPRISYAVTHGGIAYIAGVTASLGTKGDVADQTRQVLQRIDALLAKAGTDKSRLLSAQVWLTDMSHFAAHNDAWNAWVDHANAPVRMCVLSPQLWRPEMLVEIMVTAAI